MPSDKKSQSERILQHLKGGGRLTALNALMFYDCLRLGARIHDLKQQGHVIKSELVSTPNGKHVSQYYMEK